MNWFHHPSQVGEPDRQRSSFPGRGALQSIFHPPPPHFPPPIRFVLGAAVLVAFMFGGLAWGVPGQPDAGLAPLVQKQQGMVARGDSAPAPVFSARGVADSLAARTGPSRDGKVGPNGTERAGRGFFPAGFRSREAAPPFTALLWHGGIFLLTIPLAFWMLSGKRQVNGIQTPGFEIITASEMRRFIPLEEKFRHLDFVAGVKTRGSLRLSANLNKVNLSIRRYGYLLEDKNFRNALLVNRRRVRRTLLRDGDVLDLGDLTLLYRDNREAPVFRQSSVTPTEGKVVIRFDRLRGPVRRGVPMLVSEQNPNRKFFITKNVVFIGRSETNDLIIKSRNMEYRHAKIEKVGSRYKLLDLAMSGKIFVNNRRVEQWMLKEGDEITFDMLRFKFQKTSKGMRDLPPAQASAPDRPESEPPVAAAPDKGGEDADLLEE